MDSKQVKEDKLFYTYIRGRAVFRFYIDGTITRDDNTTRIFEWRVIHDCMYWRFRDEGNDPWKPWMDENLVELVTAELAIWKLIND